MFFLAICGLLVSSPFALARSCESPKYSATSFSTLDGFFHYSSTYITVFSLQCSNSHEDMPFYAVINGKSFYVAASDETAKYQVSWQLEHVVSGQQTFDIKIYDEDKFVDYKKAVQSNKSVDEMHPLFTISHYHAGISRKSPISSETVLLIISVFAVYYSFGLKNQFKN